MVVDIVSKGIVYIHLLMVALMRMAGFPQIVIYTSLLWGFCGYMSILLTEDPFNLELPSIWKYRHLVSFGVVFHPTCLESL